MSRTHRRHAADNVAPKKRYHWLYRRQSIDNMELLDSFEEYVELCEPIPGFDASTWHAADREYERQIDA